MSRDWGRLLRAWRSYRGFGSAKELSRRTRELDPEGKGLHWDTIYEFERGDRGINTDSLRLLLKALEIEDEVIFFLGPGSEYESSAAGRVAPRQPDPSRKSSAKRERTKTD